MSIAAEISAETMPGGNWNAILNEVNAWRGACLHHLSAVERAVTEALLTLNDAPSRGETIRLRQLIGQRFEDLTTAIRADGPFATEGQAASAELADYRDTQEAFRTLLCHGAIKVTIDRNGSWTLIIRSLSIRSRQAERDITVIEQADAYERLEVLKRQGQKLASTLGQLRKAIAATPIPAARDA